MSSRRGAVKVNPVTGKMEKIDPNEKLPEGKHRDGCLLVDDRYVNAAKDLGLGGANGAFDCAARVGLPLRAQRGALRADLLVCRRQLRGQRPSQARAVAAPPS